MCGTCDSVAARKVPLEKEVDKKCMQVRTQKYSKDDKEIIISHAHFRVNLHSGVA